MASLYMVVTFGLFVYFSVFYSADSLSSVSLLQSISSWVTSGHGLRFFITEESRNIIRITRRLTISETTLEETFIRSSGPGGQNVNKVSTAVRLRFHATQSGLPDGVLSRLFKLAGRKSTKDGDILIEASRFRTQEKNREDARKRLVAMIVEAAQPPPPPRRRTRPSRGATERRLQAKARRAEIKKDRGKIFV